MERSLRSGALAVASRTFGFPGNFLLRSESSSKPLTQRFQPCFLIINKPARSGRRRLSSSKLPTKIVLRFDSWRIVFSQLVFPIDRTHKVSLKMYFVSFQVRYLWHFNPKHPIFRSWSGSAGASADQ